MAIISSYDFIQEASKGNRRFVRRNFRYVPEITRRVALGVATGRAKSYLSSKIHRNLLPTRKVTSLNRKVTLPPIREETPSEAEAFGQPIIEETGETSGPNWCEMGATVAFLSAFIFWLRT